MVERKTIFGWKSVLCNYGLKGILLDSIFPVIISTLLCLITYFSEKDIYEQLKHLLDIGISVVPAMVALILTAYTIMLSFIIGDKFISVKRTRAGKELIEGLNSGFAACLFVSIIAIVTMIIVSCVANMKIAVSHSNVVNYITYFLTSYLIIFSICILIGIVIDIFNCGQTALFDDNKKINRRRPNKV